MKMQPHQLRTWLRKEAIVLVLVVVLDDGSKRRTSTELEDRDLIDRLHLVQMGIFKPSRIFQSVSECSIKADMCNQDQ